ncbi:MAG: HAD family hydrolase, partial [Anaerolineae bacterium]|nr:HAD family hydrolase [Anaerolineae bacterium]
DSWKEVYTDPATYRLFPDTLPTLKALRERGYRLGVISNWDWSLPELLDRMGLSRHFEVIAVSARVGANKPHPAIFRHALNHLGVPPERALHVGDNPEADAEGARGVGMTGVLLDRSGIHVASGRYPVIRYLTDLLDFLV